MLVNNTESFIKKARTIHGDKYDYSLVNYINAKTKVSIVCLVHGIFEQAPSGHLAGKGCSIYSGSRLMLNDVARTKDFVDKAGLKHGTKYDYSKTVYAGWNTKVIITCATHGDFLQNPGHHLGGKGCPKCGKEISRIKNVDSIYVFKEKSRLKHGDKYDYSMVVYTRNCDKVDIICPEHGVFSQEASKHTRGHGCPKCALQFTADLARKPTSYFVETSRSIHGMKYDYSNTVYHRTMSKLDIICPIHGGFVQTAHDHTHGHGCPKCSNGLSVSKKELEILEFVKSLSVNVIGSYNISKFSELDIYISDYKLAIEYNGLYFHSTDGVGLRNRRSSTYHRDKMQLCREAGISLLQIFEDEWVNPIKQEIWKSIIKHKLGLTSNRIYARKCTVVELDFKTCSQFLDENHLMGKDSSPIRYGLTHNNQLVSVITFGKPNISSGKSKYDFNIGRFSVLKDTTVVGGFSKLLKRFLKLNPSQTLSTAADLRYSTGDVYTRNGFKLTHETRPNYWYWKGTGKYMKRFHRFSFRKHVLINQLETFDPSLTEKQNMISHKWNIIYDAGNAMFEYVNQN